MTPRTRNRNRDADFKVYYSKKVPQQVHFPHKSKTVRRRSTPVRDGHGRRQMVFLPEKMRRQSMNTVGDSDEDGEDLEEDLEGGGVSIGPQADNRDEQVTIRTKPKGRKRNSDIMQEEEDGQHEDSNIHASKRQRKMILPKYRRRTRRIEAEHDDEMNKAHNLGREYTLRRQSTMTQLRDGRNPRTGSEEPEFRPVKRSPRWSRSAKGKSNLASRDQRQRTLTQMVPGMRPLEILSDEDINEALSDTETEERASQAYGDAVAQRLAQQGLYRAGKNDDEEVAAAQAENGVQPTVVKAEDEEESMTGSQGIPEPVLQSVEDDCEDSYKPTQFIDGPFRRLGLPPRRKATAQAVKVEASYVPHRPKRSVKARFSLLSTPEKRRIREIPSSQSPADSPLSTQVTPHKFNPSPLKARSDNFVNVAETPSTRKQVKFTMPSKHAVPPPRLKKFESTIQDSEDEDDDIIEEDVPLVGEGKQMLPETAAITTPDQVLGPDTQAMLGQIDQACADANATDDATWSQSSQESDSLPTLLGQNEPCPELGESHEQLYSRREQAGDEEHPTYDTVPPRIKQELGSEDEGNDGATVLPWVELQFRHEEKPLETDMVANTEVEIPMLADQLRSTPGMLEANIQDTFPSTPMAIQDDSSDEEMEPEQDPTRPHPSRRHASSHPKSNDIQQSVGLDEGAVQVPRSPSPQHETQQSHSSKAEQQLHDEWFSYSQYLDARRPESSSVRAAPDAFSYKETPRPRHKAAPLRPPHQPSGYHASQATTVDEITQRTPRNKRRQHFSSTCTTPHGMANSQPAMSPSKPPRLFIPSSFPSPEKVGMECWSSPVLGMTQAGGGYRSNQWASLEDFSIPLPPPVDDDYDDDDDENDGE